MESSLDLSPLAPGLRIWHLLGEGGGQLRFERGKEGKHTADGAGGKGAWKDGLPEGVPREGKSRASQ